MAMFEQVSVRELKNQTTKVLRQVEKGNPVTVTKRGRPIARIEPATERDRAPRTSIYERLQRQIEARWPALRRRSPAKQRADFERISRKAARGLRSRSWQQMDRAAKGDPLGLSR